MQADMCGLITPALVIGVSLLMTLRVIAHPIVLSAPAPGLVALCSNGQIVYISLETGQPVQTGDGGLEIACPYAGLTALGEMASVSLISGEIRPSAARTVADKHQALAKRRDQAHATRAPPAGA